MRNLLLIFAVTIGLSAAAAPRDPNAPDGRLKALTEIRKDMTADQVRRIVGKPDRVARQVLFRKHIEQWVYEVPNPVRVEFLCLPGEEARVLNVHHQPGTDAH